ncbi:MAG: DUF2156 domain-containing protein, partial [Clostridium sp.]
MNFKQLDLEDKEIFDKYIRQHKFTTCEYSFTSLCIWRRAYDIQYTIYKDVLLIKKMDSKGDHHFMQPLGYARENLKEIIDTLMEYKRDFHLKYLFKDVEEKFIKDLREIYPQQFCITEDRDTFDYIYESSSLIKLSGRKLRNQKNHYNNFIKNNSYKVTNITRDEVFQCIKISQDWYNHKGSEDNNLNHELKAIEELLKNREKLDLECMAVYVNEKLSAFTIGERLNSDMAIIHIEKADSKVNGLYNFINKTFVEQYFSDVPFINREEDLGIEGLRM